MPPREFLAPGDHPKREIRKALEKIHSHGGWVIVKAGHWGWLYCQHACMCKIRVDGSPSSPDRAAKDILRKARKCGGWA